MLKHNLRANLYWDRPDRLQVDEIGKAARIVVYNHPKTGRVKHASARDLRLSFAERWSTRVTPQVLMALMRHESISTTMRFYVGRNADVAAQAVWTAYGQKQGPLGAIPGATASTPTPVDQEIIDATPSREEGYKEAPVGVEPTDRGFAIRCLSHLATAPDYAECIN
jgi:hypothetical protein